jgi:hypothetical protein
MRSWISPHTRDLADRLPSDHQRSTKLTQKKRASAVPVAAIKARKSCIWEPCKASLGAREQWVVTTHALAGRLSGMTILPRKRSRLSWSQSNTCHRHHTRNRGRYTC